MTNVLFSMKKMNNRKLVIHLIMTVPFHQQFSGTSPASGAACYPGSEQPGQTSFLNELREENTNKITGRRKKHSMSTKNSKVDLELLSLSSQARRMGSRAKSRLELRKQTVPGHLVSFDELENS